MTTHLTIREIRARAVSLAPERPVETASGTLARTPLVLIDLMTEEGVVGRSYVRCYAPVALPALARLVADLGPLIHGEAASPEGIEMRLQAQFRLLGPQGLVLMAMAGIDMALWDARARARNLPLVTLLGGTPRPVPAYASLRSMSPKPAAEDAEAALAQGFTAVKVKIGRGELASDLATIRAVRSAVGARTDIMVDYNQSLSVEEAIRRVRVLDDEGLAWIEEPTRADDFAGHARIAAAARTPIQLGENCWGPHDIEKLIAAGASDHIMLDVMKLGGVTPWLRAAALAEAARLPASSHTFPEFSAHLLAVTPTAHRVEYLDHVGSILAEPVRVQDGTVLIPERPGSGVDWDEAAIAKALVD